VFHLRIFDDKKVIQDFNINEMFNIIEDTISIPGFFQPFICCCFIDSHEIFCNFFVQSEKNHYNFCVKKNEDEWEVSKPLLKIQMQNCTSMNFPQQSYYDPFQQKVNCFYRQGNCITVDIKNYSSEGFRE